ncbi:MAG TPA: type I DNA topoisomerase [Candidatus Coprovivens excrementavium]|nr:type I DNA topoisomerase [Candidatus Coprovivens excrementavium]
MKKLVIVESPSKSKTIEKYLGEDYKVVASMGHIRDLATTGKFGLGVDVDNDFTPSYIPMKGKKKVISELKKLSKDASCVYLATDPDREGEAISWHLKEALGLKKDYERVTFNEITKDVILEAFAEPRDIDIDLVKSQETRRILDRIIGFRLSKLMQSKTGGKSAGRVQSVALKLIVDREREIEAFIPEEYWSITAVFDEMEANLEKYKDKKIELKNEEEAQKVIDSLDELFVIQDIDIKEKNKKGVMPFKTSTLQQVAANKLNFASSKTMRLAQKLYEGIDIGSETVGLITYMRTDSERLSPLFIDEAFKFIKENYGDKYVGYVKKQKKNENMQDAHEGIRVTSVYRTPKSLKEYLTNDEYKLYSLIYARSLACLMADAKVKATALSLINNDYLFKATGSVLIFDGYLKVYGDYESSEDVMLPDLTGIDSIKADEVLKEQHFTKPLPRYTESSLIKDLEKLGIGRPSTYATIMETIKARDYVKVEDKKFIPTKIGIETTDKLQEGFSDIINVEYTANMEKELDEIAEAKINNVDVLNEFYDKFEPLVEDAFKNMEKKEAEKTGESCPNCGSPLVIRNGKYGEFVACSNYPECKYIKKEEVEIKEICACPNCGNKIIEKKSRRGKLFYGCNNYPKCKTAYWDKPTGKKCPNCGEMLLEKNGKIHCSSCEYKDE